MTAWWHDLTAGQQYGLVAVAGFALACLLCLAWEWIARGGDDLDILLWEAELDTRPINGGGH